MSNRVPDTNTFSLQDVVNVVVPPQNTLTSSFASANNNFFDPIYEGNKNSLYNFRNYGQNEEIEYPIPIVDTPWGFSSSPSDMVVLPENFLYGGNPPGLLLFVGSFTEYTAPNGTTYATSGNIILRPDWSVWRSTLCYFNSTLYAEPNPAIYTVDLIKGEDSSPLNNGIIFGGNFDQTGFLMDYPSDPVPTPKWCVLMDVDTPNPTIFRPIGNIDIPSVFSPVRKIKWSPSDYMVHICGDFYNILDGSSDFRGYYQYDLLNQFYVALGAHNGYERFCYGVEITKINNDVYSVPYYLVDGYSITNLIHLFKNSVYVDGYSIRSNNYGKGVAKSTTLNDGEDTFYIYGSMKRFTVSPIPDVNSNNIAKVRIDSINDTLVFNENFLTDGFNAAGNLDTIGAAQSSIVKLSNNNIIVAGYSQGYYPEPSSAPSYRFHIIDSGGTLIYSEERTSIYYGSRIPTRMLKQIDPNRLIASKHAFAFGVYPNGGTSGTLLYYRGFGTISIDGTQYDI